MATGNVGGKGPAGGFADTGSGFSKGPGGSTALVLHLAAEGGTASSSLPIARKFAKELQDNPALRDKVSGARGQRAGRANPQGTQGRC